MRLSVKTAITSNISIQVNKMKIVLIISFFSGIKNNLHLIELDPELTDNILNDRNPEIAHKSMI